MTRTEIAKRLLMNSKFTLYTHMASGTRVNFYEFLTGYKYPCYMSWDGLYPIDNRDGYEFTEVNNG